MFRLIMFFSIIAGSLTAASAQQFHDFPESDFPTGNFVVHPKNLDLPSSNIQKIVGKNDLEKVSSYPQGSAHYQLSRKVGIVIFEEGGACSGSLVGPDLFLTNEHCAFSDGKQKPVENAFFSFNYYGKDYDFDTMFKSPVFRATELVKYNKKLDYALYRLNKAVGNELGWLKIEKNNQTINSVSSVKIIQHPKGRSKEIAIKDTGLYKEYMPKGIVHYVADTEPGSSGSPVFSPDGQSIIALHHAGYNDKKGKGLVNEGILAPNIYTEIAQYLPKENSRLQPEPPGQATPTQPRRAAPAPAPQPQPQPKVVQKPEPVSKPVPKPRRDSCEGSGMVVENDDGSVDCVSW